MPLDLYEISRPPPAALLDIVLSGLASLYLFLVPENPILWKRLEGKNKHADVTGPFFIHGSPYREIERGKAVLASLDALIKHGAFLLTGRVTDEKNNPIPGVLLDVWHASTNGTYYFRHYELRGKLVTDSEGRFEILSVTPGSYGGRAGHFHFYAPPFSGESGQYDALTTQHFVCERNDKSEVGKDFNHRLYLSDAPYHRILPCWSIPETFGGKQIRGFPPLREVITGQEELKGVNTLVAEWNQRLNASFGEKAPQVAAGGHVEIRLLRKGSLSLW